MQVEHDEQADHDPGVDDEVGAAADSHEGRKRGGMLRHPDEVEAGERSAAREQADDRHRPMRRPGVDQNQRQKGRQQQLRDHR